MAKLPANFDWRKSPAHIDLLGKFIKPRDVAQVLNWQYLKDSIKENPKDAIKRFIREGILITCELDEILDCAFTASDLKKMAKEEGLKTTGTKAELGERLITANRSKMDQATSKLKIMKCSPQAREFVENFEQSKQQALESAKQKSFELLLNGDAREAYKVFLACQREYIMPELEARTYEIEKLNFILTSAPKVLGNINSSDLANLRAATCMPVLWYNEPAESWLPENFVSAVKSNKVAINYLKCNAEVREDLARYGNYAKKVKLTFDENDIESCALCLKLNEKVFDLKDFPELPFENCTSETGCKCRVDSVFDEDEDGERGLFKIVISGDDEADENEGEDDTEDDAFAKLSQLKKMLDNGLITDEEYQKKKSEILSRM